MIFERFFYFVSITQRALFSPKFNQFFAKCHCHLLIMYIYIFSNGCLSIHLSVYLSIYLYIYKSSIYLSNFHITILMIGLYIKCLISESLYLSIYLFVILPNYLFICILCLSFYISI